jgi:hypothetical protein
MVNEALVCSSRFQGWERVEEYVREDLAMMSYLLESIVISFALGGVIGALVAMHLMHPKMEAAKQSEQAGEEALEP